MAALQFDKCCCCINLRIGCLIIGYLGVIGSIIMVGLTAVGMTSGYHEGNITVKISPAVGWTNIIFTLVCGAFYVLLLVGIYKRKPTFVNVVWIAMIVYIILNSIVMLTNSAYHNAAGIIGVLLGICLSIYLALCVRSYYLVLKDEGFRPANQGGHA